MVTIKENLTIHKEKDLLTNATEEELLNQPPDEFKKKTFFEKVKLLISNITVEPLLAGIVIPSVLASLATKNLNLDKACRVSKNFSDEICDALILKNNNATDAYEIKVQELIASIEAWRSVIYTAIPAIVIVFMGAWSDKTGKRKICILLPIFGELLTVISNIINAYFFYEIPVEVTMFLEVIFPAVTGGWTLVYLGVFSYISDVTSEETRTFRVGLVNLCMTAGIPIGTALSGILLRLLGYYGVFGISATLYVMSLTYGIFWLKEPERKVTEKPNTQEKQRFLTSFFNVTSLKNTVAVLFRERPNNKKIKLILTLLVVAIIYGPNSGEHGVKYLFVRRQLHWDAVKYSLYSTYSIITHSLGALFSITIFSRLWKFDDSLLCLISTTSKFAGSTMIALVTTSFQMYMVPLVEILNATTFTSLRSIASKLVGSEESGKMNSLFSLVETLAAFVFDPIYSAVYMSTVNWLPGAVFMFSAGMTIPASIILLFFFVQHRKTLVQERQNKSIELQN